MYGCGRHPTNKIDIVCLEETKLTDPNHRILRTIGPNNSFSFRPKNDRDASDGIIIGVSKKFNILDIWEGKLSLFVHLKRLSDGWVQTFTVAYCPNNTHLHPRFGRRLRA